jgi:RNA polymerase sigma-70 factor (family 1)
MIFLEDSEIKTLVIQLQRGSEPAFNKLYVALGKIFYKKIFAMVKEEEVTEDILQHLFMKVWQKRNELDPERSFKAYLGTIAQNLVYDYLRKAASNKKIIETILITAVDFYRHTEENLISKETAEIINQAIDQLSPQRKQAFILCKIEGKSYEETSKLMGVSIATVNSHMVKSLRFLKDYLMKNPDIAIVFIVGLLCASFITKR